MGKSAEMQLSSRQTRGDVALQRRELSLGARNPCSKEALTGGQDVVWDV